MLCYTVIMLCCAVLDGSNSIENADVENWSRVEDFLKTLFTTTEFAEVLCSADRSNLCLEIVRVFRTWIPATITVCFEFKSNF